jgi:hypothetical protein
MTYAKSSRQGMATQTVQAVRQGAITPPWRFCVSHAMAKAQLDGANITDWTSFHQVSKAAFEFPDFYGNTIDAWVDCLSYLRDDDGMTRFQLAPKEVLQIEILHADQLRQNAPDILEEITYCIGGINERYVDYGELPALELILR